MNPTHNRFAGIGLWPIALICFVPAVCLVVFFVSMFAPHAISRNTGFFALGIGWLFWSFTVAFTTSRDGFDHQTFLLVMLLFPIMYPACVLFLLPVMAMRKDLATRGNVTSSDNEDANASSNSG